MAEDMILHVKETVANEIAKRVKSKRVPPLVNDFLFGPWKEVLKIIGIRDGCEGMAWSAAVHTMDDLLWSVQPKIVVKERQQLSILIPKILQSLQEGLVLLCYEQAEIDNFFDQLERLHLESLRMNTYANRAADVDGAQEAGVVQNSDRDSIMDEIVMQSDKHQSFQFDVADPDLQRSAYFDTVNTMELGTWVEFNGGGITKRGKLTWKCDFTGEYTFMDRMYKVVQDLSMRELIILLERDKAKIINNLPLIDRAVDALCTGVNSVKGYVGAKSRNPVPSIN
jgi:hypothetical protein